jgi:hypothetical protein
MQTQPVPDFDMALSMQFAYKAAPILREHAIPVVQQALPAAATID